MVQNVNLNDLAIRGRIGQTDLPKGRATVDYNINWENPETYVFDFTIIQSGGIFSTPSSMFLDNSENPSPVEVYIGQTGQYFPVPPYSSGWFTITAQENSRIELKSAGGATTGEKCFVSFANFDVPPNVWNGFAPLVDGARVKVIGLDGFADQNQNNPIIVGGRFNAATGVPLKVDASGRLEVIGAAAGGVSYGPDNAGAGTTQAPNVIAGADPGGLVRRILTTVAGLLRVSVDTSVLPTGAATEVTLAALKTRNDLLATEVTLGSLLTRANLLGTEVTLASILTRANLLGTEATLALIKTTTDAIKANSDRPATAVTTAPANATAAFTVLAAKANRKGAMITVEGSAVKLKMGATATATDYTVSLAIGDYYELPFGYTGIITGISTAATGNLRVTEIS